MRIILMVFLLICVINIAYAVPNALPVITVAFDEPVNVSTIERGLKDLVGNSFELVDLYASEDNTTFKYQPADLLDEGDYVFTIKADDVYGNYGGSQTQRFSVEIPAFKISIAEPSFGVSAVLPFDIKIQTNRYGVCKYAFTNVSYIEMPGLFEITDNIMHDINSFSKTGYFYVGCMDYYGKLYSEKFVLVHDTTDPEISQLHVEDVFQLTEGGLLTNMQVEASEPVVCKYITNDDKKEYESMNYFSGLDEDDVDSYKDSHEHNLNGNELIDYQTNYAYVICKDMADRFSSKTQEDFIVNTNQTPVTIINNPRSPYYTSNSTILFDITTNKDAECKFGEVDNPEDYSSYPYSFGDSSAKSHISTKTGFSSGTYNYHVKCRFTETGDEPSVSTTFTIDKTPPSIEYINDSNPDLPDNPEYTYYTNKLYGKWFAYDNETEITEYKYYIYLDNSYSDDVLIASETTSANDEWISGLSLNDSNKYYFKVSAKNIVGLWSSNKTSNGITVDVSLKPATCSDGTKNNDETDNDCGGSCSPCADERSCSINTDCISRSCINGTCAGVSCSDRMKNGLETDEDCGGSCQKCGNGKFCGINTDCLSENCVSGVCVKIDLCSNDVKDGDETGKDCGGSCSPCAAGSSCNLDNDCVSKNCKDNVCQLSACDDDIFNGDETGKDCGGSCPSCPVGSECETDSDCSSGVCEDNVCTESDDRDNDGLPNSWEEEYGLDPDNYDTDDNGISDADEDMDNDGLDGLTNIEEYNYGTNPWMYDTDDDGYSDKEEIEAGTDPNDPNSKPGSKIWLYLLLLVVLALIGVGSYYGYKKYKMHSIEKEAKTALHGKYGKKYKIGKELLKSAQVKRQIVRKKESPEEKRIFEDKKREKELRRKRVFEKFAPKITKKSAEDIKKENELKKAISKYADLSKISDEQIEKLKGKSISQLNVLFKGKNKDEVKGIIEELSGESQIVMKKEKIEPKKKEKEKGDVFERLSKALPYKKK